VTRPEQTVPAGTAKGRSRTRMDPEQRRAQLLQIGVRVAAARGIGRLAHAEVARLAKVSTANAFRYFPDREALVRGVIGEVDRFYRAMARDAHESGSSDPIERVHGHLFTFIDSIDAHPDYAIVWLEWSTHFRNEFGLWDAFVEFQEFVIGQLAKSVKLAQAQQRTSPSKSATDSARLIVAGAYALTQLKIMKRRRAVVVQFTEQMLAQALA
jgi:TetR/AcrR family transcriptional regulator, hemagglutinin/protease regulatory protein